MVAVVVVVVDDTDENDLEARSCFFSFFCLLHLVAYNRNELQGHNWARWIALGNIFKTAHYFLILTKKCGHTVSFRGKKRHP